MLGDGSEAGSGGVGDVGGARGDGFMLWVIALSNLVQGEGIRSVERI